MKVRPIYDRILVKVLPTRSKIGSIFVPSQHQQPSQAALVLEVGHGRDYDGPGGIEVADGAGTVIGRQLYHRQKMRVKEGDVVLYGRFSGTTVLVGEDEVTILREAEVLAIAEFDSEEERTAMVAPPTEEELAAEKTKEQDTRVLDFSRLGTPPGDTDSAGAPEIVPNPPPLADDVVDAEVPPGFTPAKETDGFEDEDE